MALEQITFNIGAFNDSDAGGNNYFTDTVFEVKNQSDNTFATIYADASGTTQIPQNGIDNISNERGECNFYIGDGDFYIEVDFQKISFSSGSSASSISVEGSGTVQDALTYATPEMYGLDNLDELQDQEESNLADKKFQIYAGIKLRNSRTSTEGLIDAPNFAGQTDYGNEPIGFIFHHYTDGTMIQADNVGEDNNIVVLKNAFNPNRRPDKASNFVGNGNYVVFDYHDYDAGFSKRALIIDKDANFIWTGAKGAAKLWQNKSEDGITAFRLQTTNSHENILDVLNGLDKSRSFTLRNDVAFTRFIFRSESSQTNGIGFEAQDGDVWLISNGSPDKRIKINKPIQATAGNTQITASTGGIVETFVPLKPRGFTFSSLPDASSYAGSQIHIIDRGYKPAYSNGADWLFVSDDAVVS